MELENNMLIEIKAATDFNPEYIRQGALKYKTLCLFFGDEDNEEAHKRLKSDSEIEVIIWETFKVDEKVGNKWAIGVIRPLNFKEYFQSLSDTTNLYNVNF